MIKLLSKPMSSTVIEGDIEITVKPVTVELQRNYLDAVYELLGSGCSDYRKKIDIARYVLGNCVEKLTVEGIEHDPVEVSESINIVNEESAIALNQIYMMVADKIEGLSEPDEKKSE